MHLLKGNTSQPGPGALGREQHGARPTLCPPPTLRLLPAPGLGPRSGRCAHFSPLFCFTLGTDSAFFPTEATLAAPGSRWDAQGWAGEGWWALSPLCYVSKAVLCLPQNVLIRQGSLNLECRGPVLPCSGSTAQK